MRDDRIGNRRPDDARNRVCSGFDFLVEPLEVILNHKTLGEFRITKVERHINGETGEPFHTVAFRSEAGDLVGIVFEEAKYIAIVDPHFPSLRFRGDDFESVLRLAIAKHRRG